MWATEAEDVGHFVVPWWFSRDVDGCGDGSVGKDAAVAGAMGDFKAFVGTDEVGGVLAGDIATANGHQADFVASSGTDITLTTRHCGFGKLEVTAAGHGLAEA